MALLLLALLTGDAMAAFQVVMGTVIVWRLWMVTGLLLNPRQRLLTRDIGPGA